MKRIFLSTLFGVGAVVAMFYSSPASKAAPTPEDYPLVCRGGGSLVLGIAPGEGNIGFSFTRGIKPAGEGLAPGECSWVDRGMYPNEPDRVSQHITEGSESLKVGGTLAPENRWYEELHSSDNYWTFMVSNNGRGQLIATRARPNAEMIVSPWVRVPGEIKPTPTPTPGPRKPLPENASEIGQIIRPRLPRARTPDDETPKRIVLNGPAEPSSETEVMKGLPGGRNMNVPPAPPSLSREEKMGLLKLAGLEAFSGSSTSYVTLTPQQPWVAERGTLWFVSPGNVNSGIYEDSIAEFPDSTGVLLVHLNFKTKGIYLVTFTINSKTSGEFVIKEIMYYFPKQTFLKAEGWQHLNMIVEVAYPGNYYFSVEHEAKAKSDWWFRSCDVTIWKK